ncbi:MAG: DUF4097 family beta strand repeat protein [Oscillospiraceae bacterium]|nr:DUF4097 family beta strand repeat protein [Oscillospiraceae bacterium]
MSKTKKWLIAAGCLVLLGCIIFAGVMTMLKWDFSKLSTSKFETNAHAITETFQNISILSDTAQITLVPSDGKGSSVVCYEHSNETHTVTVKNGTLVIERNDTRRWYEYIGISFGSPKITVSLPQGEYGTLSIQSGTGNVKIPNAFGFEAIAIDQSTGDVHNQASVSGKMEITTSTGNIYLENVSASSLSLSVSTGKVTAKNVDCREDMNVKASTGKAALADVQCKNLFSDGSTGDLTLENVIATEKFSLIRSTGDIKLLRCDAAELFIETDTGDVTGSLLTDKVFLAETETGRVDVPRTVSGGRCEITTDTGNIKITVG